MNERNPLSQVKGDVIGLRRKNLKPSVSSDYQIPAHEETQKYFFVNCERKKQQNPHGIEKVLFTKLLFLGTELIFIRHDIDIMKLWFSFKKELSRKPPRYTTVQN